MGLILASTSKYRAELLERLGVPFRSIAPDIDEHAARRPEWSPQQLATELARLKADAVAQRYPEDVIIGSDQVAECHGEVLGKPGSRQRAIAQLQQLSGRVHTLWTAVAIISPAGITAHLDRTQLQMRRLASEELTRYIDADQPLDCAGSYKIESRGIILFDQITTEDHTAITGLPLMFVTTALRNCGFAVP